MRLKPLVRPFLGGVALLASAVVVPDVPRSEARFPNALPTSDALAVLLSRSATSPYTTHESTSISSR